MDKTSASQKMAEKLRTEFEAHLFFAKGRRHTSIVAVFIAFMTLILAGMSWGWVSKNLSEQAHLVFLMRSDEIVNGFRLHLSGMIQNLKGAGGLVAARGAALTHDEWQTYSTHIKNDMDQAGMGSLVLVRALSESDLPGFLRQREQEKNASALDITRFGPSSKGGIADHAIVVYSDFEKRWVDDVRPGFDLLSHPARRAALEVACDGGQIVATSPDFSIWGGETETKKEAGIGAMARRHFYFMLYEPVYFPGAALSTALERREALRGFVGARVSVEQMSAAVISKLNTEILNDIHKGLSFSLADITDPANPVIFLTDPAQNEALKGRHLRHMANIDIGGRQWGIFFTAPEEIYVKLKAEPIAVAGLVVLIGFLLVGLVWMLGFLVYKSSEVTKANEALQRRDEELSRLAISDALTGLGNRRQFDDVGKMEWQRLDDLGRPLAVLMIDVDHFKKVNDTYGHMVGDLVLVALADVLKGAMRECDLVARVGGEEFAALLPEASLDEGLRVAERLRVAVEDMQINTPHGFLKITVSVGLAIKRGKEDAFSAVVNRADKALYKAKRAGRNRVVISGHDDDEGEKSQS